jgi:hypothetical protein
MGDPSELQQRHDRMMEIRNRHYDELMAYPGVVNVAIGFKVSGNELTDEPSIVVLVERKRLESELPPEQILPKEIEGVRIDVMRPAEGSPEVLEPGDALNGDRSSSQGTLGFFAKIKGTNDVVMVSNHHVLYDAEGQDGDEIGSPMHSGCCCCTCNVVGTNVTGVKADDCAMAKLKSGTKIKTAIPGVGQVVGTADAVMGMNVTKHGITTDVTTGQITLVTPGPPGVPVFTFRVQKNNGNDNFSKPGDSGSAVVDTATMKIVGLHSSGCNEPLAAGATGSGGKCTGPVPPYFSQSIGIGRVLTALNIEVLLADPANELVGDESDPGTAMSPFDGLADRLRTSAAGADVLDLFDRHWRECLELVRHTRPVTVAWHRSQGPSWLAAFARSIKVSEYRIPGELNGVRRADAVATVRAAFEAHGSEDLQATIDTHGDALVDLLLRHDTIDGLVAAWEDASGVAPGAVLGRASTDRDLARS